MSASCLCSLSACRPLEMPPRFPSRGGRKFGSSQGSIGPENDHRVPGVVRARARDQLVPMEPTAVRVFLDTATHYDVLGVDPSVDIVELRRAFTIAAKKYHPDRVGGADAPFKRVQAAWEVVRDEGRRREYDTTLSAGRRPRYWESNEPEPTSPRQAAQEQKEKRLKQARAVPVRVRAS